MLLFEVSNITNTISENGLLIKKQEGKRESGESFL